jgi:hypothetical protein
MKKNKKIKKDENIKKMILGGLHYHLTHDNQYSSIDIDDSFISKKHHVLTFMNNDEKLCFDTAKTSVRIKEKIEASENKKKVYYKS